MLPTDNPLNAMAKQVMSRLGGREAECEGTPKNGCQSNGQCNSNNSCHGEGANVKRPIISPAQALVIAGLIGGVLDIDSVLVDRDQEVQIVLTGSLKQKTSLEKTMDEIGAMPFDEVLRAMVGRL